MVKDDFRGENSSECVSLNEWLSCKLKSSKHRRLYKHLLKNGKLYNDVFSKYPEELPAPKVCAHNMCHRDSMLYVKQLQKIKIDMSDLSFATGFVRFASTEEEMRPDLMYFYIRHSFLLYKGKVLDITFLNHPPIFYRPDQYWGVAYKHPLMDVSWDFSGRKGIAVSLMEFILQKGGPFMAS